MDSRPYEPSRQQNAVKPRGNGASIVGVDSPDDFAYEGDFQNNATPQKTKHLGDSPYVTVDNPDDFE